MKLKTRDYILSSLFAALMALCSWLSVPAAVPFTMQTFGVFLSVALLGGRRGVLAVTVYIMLGAVGLPVFSGFRGGLGVLFSATGGYIMGFLIAALIMWGLERRTSLLASMLAGQLMCYAFGTAWFVLVYTSGGRTMSFLSALMCCVVPFVVPDAVKIALALALSLRLRRIPAIREMLS